MRNKRGLKGFLSLLFSLGFITLNLQFLSDGVLPIGQIQGRGIISPFLDQTVSFRGIVTGAIEDQNTRGVRYYTIFAQDLAGSEDGDPLSSDGIAIFLGRNKPQVALGDIVYVTGKVTEYYGLTEIDDDGLWLSIESRNNPMPLPVELKPPVDMQESERYCERLEGMLVSVSNAIIVGPTHEGCGFATVREDTNLERVFRRDIRDPVGQIINVLNASDVNCLELPSLAVGDNVEGLAGPLTFHFEQYKLIQQNLKELNVARGEHEVLPSHIPIAPSQASVATFNLDNYFDVFDDTGDIAEPKFNEDELGQKQEKLISTIANVLSCPTLIGVQEVENEPLLIELSDRLTTMCGFTYSVSHLEAPDGRGSDLALLSNPKRVEVLGITQRQGCTTLKTGVLDPSIQCKNGEEPLFSRPPLLVDVSIDGRLLTIIVNHFKSIREGEIETAPRRLAQARHLLELVSGITETNENPAVVVLGDFNDYEKSSVMKILIGSGVLLDGLEEIPEFERYSYIFDGASQLVDWILVTPWLKERTVHSNIFHVNADYPYQLGQSLKADEIYLHSSDHDIPLLVFDLESDVERVVENQVINEAGATSIEEIPTTVTNISPKNLDPKKTPVATTEEIIGNFEITTDRGPRDRELTPSQINQPFPVEDDISPYRSEWLIILPGLIVFVGLALVFLRKRKKSV